VKVYEAASPVDAQMVCDMLMSCGIDARVNGLYLTGAIGELPVDSLISVWLTDSSQSERARAIIKDMEAERKAPASILICTECQAEVYSNFNNCWRCGEAIRQS